jgi:hypothetical protein
MRMHNGGTASIEVMGPAARSQSDGVPGIRDVAEVDDELTDVIGIRTY